MRMSNLGRNLAVVDRPISEFANENFFFIRLRQQNLRKRAAGGYAYTNQCKEAYFLIVAQT